MAAIEIDAQGKVLGRLASEVAAILRGKSTPQFRTDRAPDITVVVKNVDQVRITGKKLKQKKYYNFSGYPGGLKTKRMEEVSAHDRFELAVKRMLPVNKLRAKLLKKLTILTSKEK